MAIPNFSKRKSNAIANGVFLAAIGVLLYTNLWWPGLLIAIWWSLATRQFLCQRTYDLIISSIILLGLFIVTIFHFSWDILMPVLFVVGGIYIIFREYFFAEDEEDISEKIIDKKLEIDDEDDYERKNR